MTGQSAVAIIGVGNMGAGMARNLLRHLWPVHVFDIDAHKCAPLQQLGAVTHPSAALAASHATTTIVCVVTASQVQDVLFGSGAVAQTMRLGQAVVLCPTMAPEAVEEISAGLWPLGLHCIDAPMSGGPARATDGSMSLMVACANHVFDRQRLLLETLSSNIFRIGEKPGDGARTKLVNNLAAAINLVGAAEVLVMAKHLGLDVSRTQDVIEKSSGQSWIGTDRMRRAIAGDFAPRAHLSLLGKDTRLAVQAAQAAGYRGPLGPVAEAIFAGASRAGLGGLDDGALFQWLAAADTGLLPES